MEEVRVRLHFGAPPERVFDAVSDHESFLQSSDGTHTRVLRPGAVERNGLGCLREVKAGRRARYVEEITAWERPSRFEYAIREASMPIRHEGARVQFTPYGAGTDVEWTSRFTIPVPIVGRLLGKIAGGLLTRAFTRLLIAARSKLEGD